jgi:hypothetical protein
MRDEKATYNQKIVGGCGILLFLGGLLLAGLTILAVDRAREVTRYPGAVQLSSHSNYRGLPRQYRWDDAYQTTDPFIQVYNWYSVQFDLGSERRALGQCILLEGSQSQITGERHISVLLCDTPTGRMIFVTRSTSLPY